jgi:hypothetical protein
MAINVYRTIILPAVSYRSETWFSILMKEHRTQKTTVLTHIAVKTSDSGRFRTACRGECLEMKMTVFWIFAPCILVEVYRRFRGACCLHHQGYG